VTLVLRPYQERAVEALRLAYRRGKRAPLLVAPTGAGKTVIAAYIIQSASALNNRSLFVAPRRELIQQTVRKLADAGIWDVRVIQAANDTGRPDAPVIVGSIQTLTLPRWAGRLPQADLVIADEAHHMAAKEWRKLADEYPSARWLGLSATPERADGKPLGDIFDDLIVAASVRELTDLGNLVPCRVFAPMQQLDTAELALDPVQAYQKHGADELAVVFCVTVEHARRTAEEFNAAGIPAAFISGKTSATERADILYQWQTYALTVVCNCGVLTEGFDLPALGVAILARKFGHAGLFLQCVGRVLRPHPEKRQATVVDLCGSVHEHGTPDLERTYSLDGEAISGVSRDIIRQCPSCGAVFRATGAPGCPECGTTLPRRPAELPRNTGVGVVDIATTPKPVPRSFVLAITAKFPGRCRTCGAAITPGEQIWWAKGEKPKHVDCRREVAA
jgi:DNA repair protein RadD